MKSTALEGRRRNVSLTALRLRNLGLTFTGARQAAAGMIVADPHDRARMAELLAVSLDPSSASDGAGIKVQSFSWSAFATKPSGW
jgi:hypothetical protein